MAAKARQGGDPRTVAVDELIKLQEELAPLELKMKRREDLKKLVRTWPTVDEIAGTDAKIYRGTLGLVSLGPCEKERKFKAGALTSIYKTLGLTRFIAAVSMTLKAAEASLGERLAEFIYEERTGSRPITIVRE